MRPADRFVLSCVAWLALLAPVLLGCAARPATSAPGVGAVKATAGKPSPNPVASGDTVTTPLDASFTPPNFQTGVNYSGPVWNWTAEGAPGLSIVHPDGHSPAARLEAAIEKPGHYTLTTRATATWTGSNGSSISLSGSTTIAATAVGISKLEYFQPDGAGGGSYVDVSCALYLLADSSVDLRAVLDPPDAMLPVGLPLWRGTAGAVGSGLTTTVIGSMLSRSATIPQTATATCGNTLATANLIVFALIPTAIPEDNFPGRHLNAWGVFEPISLGYETKPAGITAADLGGLAWELASGGGQLAAGTDGTGTYECPGESSSIVLDIVMLSGPMQETKTYWAPPQPAAALPPIVPLMVLFSGISLPISTDACESILDETLLPLMGESLDGLVSFLPLNELD